VENDVSLFLRNGELCAPRYVMLLYGRVHRSGELLQAFCAEAGAYSKGKRAEAWSSMLLENMLMCALSL